MAGRKRKNVKRQPNGQPARPAQRDFGTEQFQERRARLVGRVNADDQRAENVLGILELKGLITASQCKAGNAWATAMHATYGKPYASCVNLEGLPGGTPQGPSPHVERRAKAGLEALDKCGWLAVKETRSIVLTSNVPGWYRWDRNLADMQANGWCKAFLRGIAALENAMPG